MKYLLFILSLIALTSFSPNIKPGKLWAFVALVNDGEYSPMVYVREVAANDSTTASHIFNKWIRSLYKKKITIPTDDGHYGGEIISEKTILYP